VVNLMVVDLFHGDRVTSFAKAYQAGIRGIIHKATTGATGKDDAYSGRRAAALKAGLLWGAYHWGTSADVTKQLDNFLGQAKPDDQTLVALDFEPSGGYTMSLSQAREFLSKIEEKLGRKAVLYSGNLIKEKLGNKNDAFFGSHRLWLAQYGPKPSPPKSWRSYWLWQYTDGESGPDPKTVDGLPGDAKGNLDCNSFEGTPRELELQWAS
jgi:GH25 family lysozyme M1 (1,4-beta-N-acetylmuramidase)